MAALRQRFAPGPVMTRREAVFGGNNVIGDCGGLPPGITAETGEGERMEMIRSSAPNR
jgi:hypothetical protein